MTTLYAGGKAAGRSDVLTGLNLQVPAGGSLALVGASGSGKSTVLRLLYRLYDAQEGSVMLGRAGTPQGWHSTPGCQIGYMDWLAMHGLY